jgi:heme oxygenase
MVESLFGYYAPVEPLLAQLAPSAPPLGLDMPPRAQLLARDLIALGYSEYAIAALPWCPDLPRLVEPAHLAGCLYVLEGARLGAVIISRALERTLAIGPGDGASFFHGDGEVVARRWKRVLVWLDEVARSGAPVDEIVDSASATFRTLSRWMEARGAYR